MATDTAKMNRNSLVRQQELAPTRYNSRFIMANLGGGVGLFRAYPSSTPVCGHYKRSKDTNLSKVTGTVRGKIASTATEGRLSFVFGRGTLHPYGEILECRGTAALCPRVAVAVGLFL